MLIIMAIAIMCSLKMIRRKGIIKPAVEVKIWILAQLGEHFKF